jgi:nucleotide-binding universal stress UspA family protein
MMKKPPMRSDESWERLRIRVRLMPYRMPEDTKMKVLLAIDSSALSAGVIDEAARRPWPPGTEIRVLTVMDLFALTYSVGYLEPFAEKETNAAEALVRKVAERLQAQGINTTTRVLEGYPSTAIVDEASEWKADLIFIGSHGHGGLVGFFVGSVAKSVVHNAHCSVEIVRPREISDIGITAMKLLLATDGSDFSTAAAKSVADRPWPPASEVKVVSIADVFVPAVDPWYTAGEMMEQIREASLAQAKDAVIGAEKILSDAGMKTSSEVLMGSPKARIVEEASQWGANLIVVGSHGRRGLSRVLIGSVSEAIAIRAHCSVEVIRVPAVAKE